MKIHELNGKDVKKLIKAKSCSFRYHNRNNSGGNFGFEIRGLDGKDYELNGEYRNFIGTAEKENPLCMNGLITTIKFGKVYWPRIELIKENLIDARFVTLKDILERMMTIINSVEIK